MNDTEKPANKGMIRFVLTAFVIAIILAVAYLTFFTLGQVEPGQPISPTANEGGR